jgi:hypothetical protein
LLPVSCDSLVRARDGEANRETSGHMQREGDVERGSREKRGYLRETGAGDSGETTERGETWDNDRREGTACQMIGWRQFRCLLVEGQAVGGIRRDHDEEPLTPCRDPRRQGRVDHQLRPQHLPLDQDRRCRPRHGSHRRRRLDRALRGCRKGSACGSEGEVECRFGLMRFTGR